MVSAQHGVSGYVDMTNQALLKQKVYVSQIVPNQKTNTYNDKIITSSIIAEDGFFSFDQNVFKPKDHIYKIQLYPLSSEEKDLISDTIKNFKLFILSKKDTIHFKKSETLFAEYTTSNLANREWQKLKRFQTTYEDLSDNFDTEEYLMKTKGYVKDSLQILLVKLIGIKKLDDKGLLTKDVKEHPEYYMDFLHELKSSDLDPATYAYLENKLLVITRQITNQRYEFSLWINIIAFVLIIALSMLLIALRKKIKKTSSIPLSKQEKAVKELIISGKSNKEIANELFISLSTVKTHITNIYSKLNIAGRQDLFLKK